jgi:HEAT repeats
MNCGATASLRTLYRRFGTRSLALWAFALCLVLRILVCPPSAFAQKMKVEWKNQRLSVSAREVPLSEILIEISRQTGIEVGGLEELHGQAVEDFSSLPLREGLEKLLSGRNYAIINKPSCANCASQVWVVVFGKGDGLPPDFSFTPIRRDAAGGNRTGVEDTGSDKNKEAKAIAAADEDEQTLRKALLDPDPAVQAEALQELAERPGIEALDALLSAARSKDPTLRLQGLELLSQSTKADRETVLSVLGEALQDKDPDVQEFTVQTLVTEGGSDGIDLLRRAFHDADVSLKTMIVDSLGSTPDAVPLLEEASSDSDESISTSAAALLEEAKQQESPVVLSGPLAPQGNGAVDPATAKIGR